MIHTYRDSDVLGRPTSSPRVRGVLTGIIIVTLVFLGSWTVGFWRGSTGADRAEGFAALALFLGFAYVCDKGYQRRRCREIRLFDDSGVCELETERGVIRLHVNQIRSVRYERDGDSRAEYWICHQDGTIPVNQIGDFPDFLARLKSLNPDLDLSSFPSKVLPGVDTTAPGAQGIRLGRRLRAALFPVGVIVLLVWLAFEAFQST